MIKNRGKFLATARQALSGLEQHAEALELRRVSEAELRTALDTAVAANLTFQAVFSNRPGRELREARKAAQALVAVARDYLKPFLGRKWSAHWPKIGFRTPSLRLPRTDAALLHVLYCLEEHFIAHPTRANEELGLTAPAFKQRRDAFQIALDAVSGCATKQLQCRNARATAERELEEKMRTLRLELAAALKPNDPRWFDFTGRVPASPRVPEPVKEVTATVLGRDAVHLAWPRAARAKRYKIYLQAVGMDAAPSRVKSARGREALLIDLPPEGPLKIRVVPTNSAGDGIACEVTVERKVAA